MGLKVLPPLVSALPNRLGYGDADGGEAQRRKAQPWRNWYKLKRWYALRDDVLRRDLMTCQQTGVLLTDRPNQPHSAIVDHIKPHKGNPAMFWNIENLQAVSKQWHDTVKQAMEKAGNAY